MPQDELGSCKIKCQRPKTEGSESVRPYYDQASCDYQTLWCVALRMGLGIRTKLPRLLSVECSTDYSSYCVYLYHSQCRYDWIQ